MIDPILPTTAVAARPVCVQCGSDFLTGFFQAPAGARAVAIIGNDSGIARHVPARVQLAGALRDAGFATLVVDLLTPGENGLADVAARLRMDALLLAERMAAAREWVARRTALPVVLIGLEGAAPAALLSAVARPDTVSAVVACGPHPDAAGAALARLRAPVLLIVRRGRFDESAAHSRAMESLPGKRDLLMLRAGQDPVEVASTVAREVIAFLRRVIPSMLARARQGPMLLEGGAWGKRASWSSTTR